MRNPIDVLNSLSDKSKDPNYRFERLYRNLYNPEFYLLAYKNVYANDGSMTPGVDGNSLDGMSTARIQRIINSLRDRSYQPSPARRTYIEKKNSTKKRPLGIPSADDKLVQEVIRLLLESIYEPNFSENSHGFRPKRSCHTALMQIQRTFKGANWFVEGDIKACFDSFNHQVLVGLLRKRIADEAFIGLIWKFLKAGYMEQWTYHTTYSGTPQGSGMSPILANIYLSELDSFMEKYKQRFSRGNSARRKADPEYDYLHGKIQRIWKRNAKGWDEIEPAEKKKRIKEIRELRCKQRALPSQKCWDESFKSIQYVRYADDFLIGVIGSKEDAEALRAELAIFLRDDLGLTLSMEKTKITHSAEKARFLGYDICISRSQEVRKLSTGRKARIYSGAVMLYAPYDKWSAKLLELKAIRIKKDSKGKEHWKIVHRGELINRSDIEILRKYNSEVRGMINYYSLACNTVAMIHFRSVMKYSMLKTFAAKYRTKVSKIKARYEKNGEFTVPYETKAGAKESTFDCKPIKRSREPLFGQVDLKAMYKKYGKPNGLAQKLKAKTCELCGSYSDNIEIHQVKRLKDADASTTWGNLMRERHRKTLAVCPMCHIAIHETMKS